MSGDIIVRTVDAYELAGYAGQLERLYRECFSTPPWLEPEERLAGFPDRFAAHLNNAGTSGVMITAGPAVLGVVYGWPAGESLASGSPFDDALSAAATPEAASRLVAPAVVVAELMVDPRHQRQGIGSALLDRYVADWPAAWLATHPEAPAARMYRRAGWREEFEFAVTDSPLVIFTWQARHAAATARRGARR